MTPSLNTCCSTIIFPNFGSGSHPLPIPVNTVWKIKYKIGSIFITGDIFFTDVDNPLTKISVQAKIDSDPTYITSGTTITVDSLSSMTGLTVTICKPSTSKITDNAEGIFDVTQI